jgi:hypothetical protein
VFGLNENPEVLVENVKASTKLGAAEPSALASGYKVATPEYKPTLVLIKEVAQLKLAKFYLPNP